MEEVFAPSMETPPTTRPWRGDASDGRVEEVFSPSMETQPETSPRWGGRGAEHEEEASAATEEHTPGRQRTAELEEDAREEPFVGEAATEHTGRTAPTSTERGGRRGGPLGGAEEAAAGRVKRSPSTSRWRRRPGLRMLECRSTTVLRVSLPVPSRIDLDPYLTLTGPNRAPVLCDVSNSVRFEVVLKVKGATNESEDKDLSFLASKYKTFKWRTHVIKYVDTSKLCKLEWTFGNLAESVEATINIQVIHGSWPDGFRGIFSVNTISLDDMKVKLLSIEDGKLPLMVDGTIKLSRHVVSIETEGELKIFVAGKYANGEQGTINDEIAFTPRIAGRSSVILDIFSCQMKVIIAWSLVCKY